VAGLRSLKEEKGFPCGGHERDAVLVQGGREGERLLWRANQQIIATCCQKLENREGGGGGLPNYRNERGEKGRGQTVLQGKKKNRRACGGEGEIKGLMRQIFALAPGKKTLYGPTPGEGAYIVMMGAEGAVGCGQDVASRLKLLYTVYRSTRKRGESLSCL